MAPSDSEEVHDAKEIIAVAQRVYEIAVTKRGQGELRYQPRGLITQD